MNKHVRAQLKYYKQEISEMFNFRRTRWNPNPSKLSRMSKIEQLLDIEALENFKFLIEELKVENEFFLAKHADNEFDRMTTQSIMSIIAYYHTVQEKAKREKRQEARKRTRDIYEDKAKGEDKKKRSNREFEGMSYVYQIFETSLCNVKLSLSQLKKPCE
jgi:hypothetical protein